jgi:thiazole/oxazole-forming peptide maturase SagD family component
MEHYCLAPTWDVIPREGGVDLVPLGGGSSVRLADLPGSLSVATLVQSLLGGMLPGEFEVHPYAKALREMKAVVLSAPKPFRRSRSYLKMLMGSCVGPGRIVSSLRSILENEGIAVSYSLGFGPRLIRHQSSLNVGWGADANPELAQIKAIVEGVERYALGDYDLTRLQSATYTEMRALSLEPAQMGTTSEALESAGQLHWCPLALSRRGGRTLYAPLDWLRHPVDYGELGRPPVCPLNISGVAAHQSREAASTNAILELCEHEALMVAWYGRRTCPTIDPASLNSISQRYLRLLEERGWRVILMDISLDLAPVVMAVALGPEGKRAMTIGSCAAFSLYYATAKALSEVVRTVLVDEAMGQEFESIAKEEVQDILGHGLYYATSEHVAAIAWLWERGVSTAADDRLSHMPGMTLDQAQVHWQAGDMVAEEYRYLHDRVLGDAGLPIYTENLTPDSVKEDGLPLVVVRAVVPEMARLTVGYGVAPAKTRRFERLVGKYGNGRMGTELPHPFS